MTAVGTPKAIPKSPRFPYWTAFVWLPLLAILWLTSSGFTALSSYVGLLTPTGQQWWNPVSWHYEPFSSKGYRDTGRISWFSCPDDSTFKCGYIDVPLNYLDSSNKRKVSIALRKYPARCAKEEYRGSMFINPGGPGSSGTGFAYKAGKEISLIVQNKYDIIGFDPRGVNMTEPAFNCTNSDYQSEMSMFNMYRMTLPLEGRGEPYTSKIEFYESLDADPKSAAEIIFFDRQLALQTAMIKGCMVHGDKEVMQSASTAFAARDMVSLLDALHQDKLHYWGLSYGTHLGATFAAMFPDRVGRAVLDGVVDSEAWTTRFHESQMQSLGDSAETLSALSLQCANHPSKCILESSDSNNKISDSVIQLVQRIFRLSSSLKKYPLPVPLSMYGPGIVTASILQWCLFMHLYWPVTWPSFAHMVVAAERGDGKELLEYFISKTEPALPEAENPFGPDKRMTSQFDYAFTSIVQCMDSALPNEELRTREGKVKFARNLANLSVAGDIWSIFANMRSDCTLEPFEAYRGPWTMKEGLRKTAFPLLFIGNTLDPITPLSSAVRMVANFGKESAAMLLHDGYGHCSIAQPSLCTAKAIRAYFLEGQVPLPDSKCPVQQTWPFAEHDIESFGEEDVRLMQALEKLASAFA